MANFFSNLIIVFGLLYLAASLVAAVKASITLMKVEQAMGPGIKPTLLFVWRRKEAYAFAREHCPDLGRRLRLETVAGTCLWVSGMLCILVGGIMKSIFVS